MFGENDRIFESIKERGQKMKPTKNSLFPYYTKVDLSKKEFYRIYIFPNKEEVIIKEPQYLIVSDNGHRVLDKENVSHYIPYGWIHLYWKNKSDRPNGFFCEEKEEDFEDEE